MQLGRDLAQAGGEAADPQRLEAVLQRVDQRADILDMGTERLEVPGRLGDQLADLRVGFDVAEIEAQPDPPAAHAIVETDRMVARVGRQRTPVARIGPGRDVERQRGVEHRARQHTLADHVGERQVGRVLGDAAVARLQPDEAGMAAGMRIEPPPSLPMLNALMPAPRPPRRRRRNRRASAPVPWIARHALQRRIGHPSSRTRGSSSCRGGRGRRPGICRRWVRSRRQPSRLWHASRSGSAILYRRRVLDRGRHAVERRQRLALQPARLRGLRRRPGAIAVDQDKSIEGRLQFRCALTIASTASTGERTLRA